MAEEEGATIIICGNHGRKGPKAEDETVAGTAIQYLSLSDKFPVVVLKDYRPRKDKPDGCLRYGVCYDGSVKANKALEVCLSLMQKRDKLVTITVTEDIIIRDHHHMKDYIK